MQINRETKINSVLYALAIIILAAIIFPHGNPGYDDAYYHLRHASLYKEIGLEATTEYPNLSESSLSQNLTDQWLGHHLLLQYFPDDFFGAKAFSFLSILLIGFLIDRLFKSLEVPYRAIGVIFIFISSNILLYRLNAVRSINLSLIILVGLLWSLVKEKRAPVFILSALYSFSYIGGAIYAIFAALIYLVTNIKRSSSYLLTGLVFTGVIVGVILHPQFINYFELIRLVNISFILNSITTYTNYAVELNPLQPSYIFHSMGPAVGLWIVAMGIYILNPRDKAKNLFLGLSVLFFIFALIAQRFSEYYLPLSGIFSASVLLPYLRTPKHELIKYAGLIALSIILITGVYYVRQTNRYMHAKAFPLFPAAGEQLKSAQRGDIVFNAQWDLFSPLFFYNPDATYIVGMDPNFMFAKSPEKFWLWQHISSDQIKTCERSECSAPESVPSTEAIEKIFQAKYVFLDERNPKLKTALAESGNYHEIYNNSKIAIFQISSH